MVGRCGVGVAGSSVDVVARRSLASAALVAGALALSHCASDANHDSQSPRLSKVQSVGGVLNVASAPYNAVPGVDSYAAIQAAINDSCTATRMPVYIPEGIFPISQPLLDCGTEIFGESRQGTVIKPTFGGPAIITTGKTPATYTTAPALVGGSGNALVVPTTSATLINLRDVPTVELDGLNAFTAEAFVNVTSYGGPYEYDSIVSSDGYAGTGGVLGLARAFSLAVYASQQFYASMTIGGTQVSLIDPTPVTLGSVHHVALTYDGAQVRLFVDGALVSSAAASGPVTQSVYEDVNVGGMGLGLEGQAWWYSFNGTLDSLRLSNVARYTAPFAVPTAKLQPDASTLALANFEATSPGVFKVWSGTTPYLVPIRNGSNGASSVMHNFTIDGGMGLLALGAWAASFYQLDCLGCDYGIFTQGNTAGNRFSDLFVSAGSNRGRYGVFSESPWGGNDFQNLTLEGQRLPFVANGSNSLDIATNVTIDPGQDTVFGALFSQDQPVINGVTIGSGGASYKAGLVIAGPTGHPLIMNANVAGQAGRVRRQGPPAASSAVTPTRSVVPILVDDGFSPYPTEATPIVDGANLSATMGDPELVGLNYTPAAGAVGGVLMGVTADSASTLTNDPNAVTMASPGAPLDPRVIPPMDPGSISVTSNTIGPEVFDVGAYGAVPNSGLDAAPGIQAAVNAACARGGGTVLLSVGSYDLNQPVLVNCNLEIDGASDKDSALVSGAGPALILNPPGMTSVDLAPGLFGSGNAMRTNGSSYWVDLRGSGVVGNVDGGGASTNTSGFTGFTAEAIVETTSTTSGYAGIVQSAGCLGTPGGTLPGCSAAFQLGTMDGNLYGSLTVAGTSYSLQGPALTANTVHHVAVTYDGTQTIRLFLDGAPVQTATTSTTSGTITQQFNEDVSVGPESSGFYGAIQHPAIAGIIDSVRLSTIDRYTEAFPMPTAKLAYDGGNTLAIVDFATNVSGTTLGRVYLPIVRSAEPDGTPEKTLSVTLKNLEFVYYGVFGVNAVNSKYQNLYAELDDGFHFVGNSSGSLFDNLSMYYPRVGVLAVNSSNSVFNNIYVRYSPPLVINGGSNIQVNSVTSQPGGGTAPYQMYLLQSDVRLVAPSLDNAPAPGNWQGFIVVDHPTAPFRLYGGTVDWNTMTSPSAITIDSGQGYVLEGTRFGSTVNDQEVIHLNAPLAAGAPHKAIGIHFDKGSTPSDDPDIQLINSSVP